MENYQSLANNIKEDQDYKEDANDNTLFKFEYKIYDEIEIFCLALGLQKFGQNWKKILTEYKIHFHPSRTAETLKKKYHRLEEEPAQIIINLLQNTDINNNKDLTKNSSEKRKIADLGIEYGDDYDLDFRKFSKIS